MNKINLIREETPVVMTHLVMDWIAACINKGWKT